MDSRRTITLSSITLTEREHLEMRRCIDRIRKLGIRDNRLTNLTDRMSLTLKKSARRAERGCAGAADFFGEDLRMNNKMKQ